MHDAEFILCTQCQTPTCVPPPELMQYSGLCVGCAMKRDVLPLVEAHLGSATRDLVEATMECARENRMMQQIADHIDNSQGIAIVVGTNGPNEDQVSQVLEAFKKALMTDPKIRAGLKDVLEVLEQEMPIPSADDPIKVDKPVYHNDPRWG